MIRTTLVALALLGFALAAPAGDLAPAVKVTAEGGPIDVEVGHAAPCFADIDGDGLRDLLVGQFGGGKLRIYPNVGKAGRPSFKGHVWMKAGGALGSVPHG